MKNEIRIHGDRGLLILVGLLCAVGLIMVSSASSALAFSKYGDTMYFVKKQALWLAMGLPVFLFCATTNLSRLRSWARPMALPCLFLPGLALIPGFGIEVNGAARWIRLGPITVQPVELAKLALIFYLADSLSRKGERIRRFVPGVAVPFGLAGLVGLVLIAQPDLGNAILIMSLVGSLLFLSGARLTHLVGPALAALPVAYHLIFSSSYRRARVFAFLDPFADPRNTGFQLIQSFIAFGSGGLMGKGLGNSGQKLFYLPEAHTDFVFSILGEECGLWGTTGLVILFTFFAMRGARIAQAATDPYYFGLAWGLTGLLFLPALMNMAVATGLIPTKGMPMPFVSYGGSSLVVSLAAAGLLYNISRINAISRYT